MNGPHDIGGRHGFGPVKREDDITPFHADWEKRILGLTLTASALGYWTLDAMRHARESLPPATYYNASYYEIWLRALEAMLVKAGEISESELAEGHAARAGNRRDRRLGADNVPTMLSKGGPTERPGPSPRFKVGDTVRTRNHQPISHTRLPAYARNCCGTIVTVHGCHVFPDTNARAEGEHPSPLYTVGFAAPDLYGEDADPTLTVMLEVWEPYLDQS